MQWVNSVYKPDDSCVTEGGSARVAGAWRIPLRLTRPGYASKREGRAFKADDRARSSGRSPHSWGSVAAL